MNNESAVTPVYVCEGVCVITYNTLSNGKELNAPIFRVLITARSICYSKKKRKKHREVFMGVASKSALVP